MGPNQVATEEEHWVVTGSTTYNAIRRGLVAHQSGLLVVQGNNTRCLLLIGEHHQDTQFKEETSEE